jgi:hypothetical protein
MLLVMLFSFSRLHMMSICVRQPFSRDIGSSGAHDDSEKILALETHIKATTNLSYYILEGSGTIQIREASRGSRIGVKGVGDGWPMRQKTRIAQYLFDWLLDKNKRYAIKSTINSLLLHKRLMSIDNNWVEIAAIVLIAAPHRLVVEVGHLASF